MAYFALVKPDGSLVPGSLIVADKQPERGNYVQVIVQP